MGGKSKQEIVTKIKNEVNVKIKNHTENVTNIINETITNVSNTIIHNTVVDLGTSIGGSSIIRLSGDSFMMSGNAIFTVDNTVNINLTNSAVASVKSDSKKLSEMATNIQNDVTNKLQSNIQAQADLKAINVLKNIEMNEGGDALVAKGLESFNKMVGSITGSSEEVTVRKDLETILNQEIESSVINKNTFHDIVNSTIKTDVINTNVMNCPIKIESNAIFTFDYSKVVLSDNAQATFKNVASVVQFNNCVLSSVNTSDIIDKITKESINTASNDITAGTAAESKMDIKNEDITENIQKSAMVSIAGLIADVYSKLGMAIIFAIVIVIGLLIYLLKSFGLSEIISGATTLKGSLRKTISKK